MATASDRNFFLILIDERPRTAMFLKLPTGWRAAKAARVVGELVNTELDEDEPPVELDQEFTLLDWSTAELPQSTLVREIPKPGILFAIGRLPQGEVEPGDGEDAEPLSASTVAWFYRRLIQRDDGTFGDRYRRHMSSGDAEFESSPIAQYDAFISYSFEDSELAMELAQALDAEGFTSFLASRNVSSGRLWQEAIRLALAESRTAILLLTPNSVTSDWIMCEAGACWALQKPMVPATQYVDVKSLPELISAHQSRKLETLESRKLLVEDIRRLCERPEEEDIEVHDDA